MLSYFKDKSRELEEARKRFVEFPPKYASQQWYLLPAPVLAAIMQRSCKSSHERATVRFQHGACIDLFKRVVLSKGESINACEKCHRCNLQSN